MEKKNTWQAIIAHPLPEEQRRIAALLENSGFFSICHTTHDGLDCLRQVVSLQPELVLIHGVLDKIDGLEVLRRLREFPLPNTRCVYLTTYNGYLAQHALLTGAQYSILMPCSDELLVQRAVELIQPPRTTATDEEIDAHTAQILQTISAPANKKGYYYTLDAVRILVRDPELVMRRKVITELYGAIAQLHNLENPEQVERCLRTLTSRVFTHNSVHVLETYFNLADTQRGHITNTAFLTAIAKQVRAELRSPEKTNQSKTGPS